jgi:hypothetical protein
MFLAIDFAARPQKAGSSLRFGMTIPWILEKTLR